VRGRCAAASPELAGGFGYGSPRHPRNAAPPYIYIYTERERETKLGPLSTEFPLKPIAAMNRVSLQQQLLNGIENFVKGGASNVEMQGSPGNSQEGKAKTRRAAEIHAPAETPATIGLVKRALQESQTAFANVIGAHVEEIQSQVDTQGSLLDEHSTKINLQEKQITDLNARLSQLEVQARDNNTANRLTEVEASLTTMQNSVEAAGSSFQPSGGSMLTSPGHGGTLARRWAVIGSLGWDLEAAELLRRAKECLSLAQVAETEYDMLSCMRTPGSMVKLRLKSEELVSDVRNRFSTVGKTYSVSTDNQKVVWLNFMKSEQERLPGRQQNRASKLMQEVLTAKGSTDIVESVVRPFRKIKLSSTPVAEFPVTGMRWTNHAATHFSKEEQRDILDAVQN